MHMFLTGDIQVGKSTLINRFLAAHPEMDVGGFRTIAGPKCEDGSDSVHIVPASKSVELNRENRILRRTGVPPEREIHVFTQVFNTVGISLLEQPADCQLILMDEIGVQENGARQFRKAVLWRLDGDIPVLGVVRSKEGVLTDAVRAHP